MSKVEMLHHMGRVFVLNDDCADVRGTCHTSGVPEAVSCTGPFMRCAVQPLCCHLL